MWLPLVVSLLVQSEQKSESGLRYTTHGGGGKAPMIIFLHGTYGNASYWGGFVTAAKAKGYLAVLPLSTGDGGRGDKIPRWGDEDIPKVVGLAREMQRKHGADPRRTHIAGFSNGAFYAFEIALRHPEIFSSVLCMGGGCSVNTFSEPAKEIGAYIVHGTKDTSVGFDAGLKSAEKLKKAGFKDVVFKEKTGKGHVIFFDEVEPYFDWLKDKKRRTCPGANTTLKWSTDLDAAAKSGNKILLYLYSPKDEYNDFVDWIEGDLFLNDAVIAQAADFTCVKLNRDEASLPEGLATKSSNVTVFEMEEGKPKILTRLSSVGSAKSTADRLKMHKKK
jgi:predicted esterase